MSSSNNQSTVPGKIPTLTGTRNYVQWAWSIEGTAQLGTFWSAYIGTNNPLNNSVKQKDTCLQREMKALGLIKTTVNQAVASEIQSMPEVTQIANGTDNKITTTTRPPNAKEIWEHLKFRYQKQDPRSKLDDLRLLLRPSFVDDGSLEAQLNNLIQVRSRCVLHGLTFEDYLLASIILAFLPDSYLPMAESLVATNGVRALTVEGVCVKILETENLRKAKADSTKGKEKEKAGDSHTLYLLNSNNDAEYEATESSSKRGDTAAEPWLMNSSATDHITPFRSDFTTYSPYIDSKQSVTLGDDTTRLDIIGSGTIRRWCRTPRGYTTLEMANVLHVKNIKKRFLSVHQFVLRGSSVNLTEGRVEIRDKSGRLGLIGTREGSHFWLHLHAKNPKSAPVVASSEYPECVG